MGYGIFFSHLKKEALRRGGEVALPRVLAEAKALGADRITDDAATLNQHLPLLREAGMGVNIVYCVSRLIHGEDLSATLQAAEDTAKAGGTILMLVPGFYENGLTDDQALRNAAPLVKEVVRVGNGLGIHVTMENYGGRKTPYSTVPQIVRWLDAVEGLEFVYDSGNLLYHRQDPMELWDAARDRIAGVHLKDLSDRPEGEQAPITTPAGDVRYPTWFGGGLLPAKQIVRRIREKGIPPQAVTFEHDGNGAPDTLEFLKKSIETMKP